MLCQATSTTLFAAAALAAATVSLPAQSQQLLGMTQNIPLVQQHDQGGCIPTQRCPLPFAPAPFLAGASAWDGVNSWLWVTDGFQVGAVEENGCTQVCPPQPSPLPGPVSGLTVFEAGSLLYAMDLGGNIVQYQLGCPLVPGPVCTIASLLPANFQFTALAADDLRGLLFIGCTDPLSGASVIQIADLANPCNPFAIFQMGNCGPTGPIALPFGPLTGLAADGCKQLLYATDGLQTQELSYFIPGPPPTIGFILNGCCNLSPFLPNVDPYAGLAIRPIGARQTGTRCTTGTCAPCVPRLEEQSDPILGNPAYTIAMVDAPANATAWIGFNLGSCTAVGTPVPPFCAPVFLPLTPGLTLLGPIGTGGTPGSCDGFVASTGPIPLNPALCGVDFSAQAVVFCANAAGTGTAVSACLTTSFQGL